MERIMMNVPRKKLMIERCQWVQNVSCRYVPRVNNSWYSWYGDLLPPLCVAAEDGDIVEDDTNNPAHMYACICMYMYVCMLCIYVLCVYTQTTEGALPAIMPKRKQLPNEYDRGNAGGEETEKWRE